MSQSRRHLADRFYIDRMIMLSVTKCGIRAEMKYPLYISQRRRPFGYTLQITNNRLQPRVGGLKGLSCEYAYHIVRPKMSQ